jgi:DsbE subfamily thiol:disulfide oxidoreductase
LYANPPQPLSTVAIHTNLVSDLYAVLGEPDAKGGYVVRIYHNPLVPWLFFGAVVMVFGGIVSLTDRHHRIGAPLRRLAAKIPMPAVKVAAASAIATDRQKGSPSWMYVVPTVAFTVLVGFFIYRLYLVEEGYAPNLIPSVLIDKSVPTFNLPALQVGEPGFKSVDLRGKVTVINFFASWCLPCREEHFLLPQITNAGIVLIGINYKDRPEDAKSWLAQLGNPYGIVAVDANGRTAIDFGLYGVPESYLIDKQGVIRWKQTGPLTPDIIRDRLLPMAEQLNK